MIEDVKAEQGLPQARGRRGLRFTVASLFWLTLVVCLTLAWLNEMRRSRRMSRDFAALQLPSEGFSKKHCYQLFDAPSPQNGSDRHFCYTFLAAAPYRIRFMRDGKTVTSAEVQGSLGESAFQPVTVFYAGSAILSEEGGSAARRTKFSEAIRLSYPRSTFIFQDVVETPLSENPDWVASSTPDFLRGESRQLFQAFGCAYSVVIE